MPVSEAAGRGEGLPTPVQEARPKAPRELYVTKRHVGKYGATPGCGGCVGYGVKHTAECRERLTKLVQEDPEEIERTTAKVTQRIVKELRSEAAEEEADRPPKRVKEERSKEEPRGEKRKPEDEGRGDDEKRSATAASERSAIPGGAAKRPQEDEGQEAEGREGSTEEPNRKKGAGASSGTGSAMA